MRTLRTMAEIEAADPEWAARLRRSERERRRRLRMSPAYVQRERELERAAYAANPDAYNQRKSAWCKENPEKRRAIKTKCWQTRRAQHMHGVSRRRAKAKGVAFDLTVEWIEERLRAGHCELSGLPFDFETPRGRNAPSMDRKKAAGGYTQDNCRIILGSLNRALFTWGDDYYAEIARAVLAKRGEI